MTDQNSSDNHMQDRINNIFSGQDIPSYASIREMESMQVRIRELEAQLASQEPTNRKPTLASEVKASHPTPTQVLNQQQTKTEETAQLQAHAFRAALVMLVVAVLALPPYFYFTAQTSAWQLNVLIWISIGLTIISGGSVFLARKGHVNQSMILLIGTLCLIVPGISTMVSGLGIVLGLSLILVTFTIISQTLKDSFAAWTSIASIFAGLLAVLIDLFGSGERLAIPELQVMISIIAIIVLSTLGLTVIRQFANYSLRAKLVIVFAGLALASVSAVALVTNRVVSTEIHREVGTNLAAIAEGKALEIGATIDGEKDALETLTLNKLLQDQAEAANLTNTANQDELDRLDQQWRNASSDTEPLIRRILSNDVADELREFQQRFPQFVEVFLTDKYGANIASTNRTSDYYQADEKWWQVAWNDGKGGLFISQPEYDESAGIYAIDMALPLMAHNRSEIVGILRATVDVTPLKQILLAGQIGETGRVELVFPDGQFLSDEPGVALLTLHLESADQLKMLGNSYSEFIYQGTPSLVSKSLISAPIAHETENIEALGWYVVVHQDKSEALQPLTVTTRTTLLVSLGVLMFAGALAFFMGRLLTSPLAHLTSVAVEVAGGNMTVQAHVNSRDEIGTLATTFNNMTHQLHDLLSSLEQRVADRTHDLELAHEVGQAVTEKVGDLSNMLTEAVETIRSKFDLYYTQVYLVDPSERNLLLRAGTGEVGAQLLGRSHRLAISPASLNGRAASERTPVLVGNTEKSPTFLPNPLLPKTRSELAVPLIASGKVVGVLDMQSERTETFSEANIPAFQVLAAQLAIAIQNAALFEKAEASRLEVAEQARRLTSSSWQDFLNAINRSERIGFTFNQNAILSVTETQPSAFDNVLEVPIQITGAKVGEIRLADEPDRQWTNAEKEVVAATASRVAQHIENLRLLAQAEQYRSEAEQVSRRLTREGWDTFLETHDQPEAYIYDLNEVQPLSENGTDPSDKTVRQLLVVRDEPIGELAVDTDTNSDEAAEILEAVGQHLSQHIENLRLSISNVMLLGETEERAKREQALREITTALRSSTDPATIIRTAVREVGRILNRKTLVQMAVNGQSDAISNNGHNPATSTKRTIDT